MARVTIVQRALPKYRIPVFQELARRPDIELQVVYAAVPSMPNVQAQGFRAVPSFRWETKRGRPKLAFHPAQWKYCVPEYSDVVILGWTPAALSTWPALCRAKRHGVATILWGHGYSKGAQDRQDIARRWLAKRATALVFYDPDTRLRYCEEGLDGRRMFVALNCIDHSEIDAARSRWLQSPTDLLAFQRAHELIPGPVVSFVSRLQPDNRVDLLVKATAKLRTKWPFIKTVIIGNGAQESHKLQELVDKVDVRTNILFKNGIYDEVELAPWLLSSSVFCYPANVGLSLIHALWYGLPVVTTDNRFVQNPEIVAFSNGVNGLTYRDGDSDSLAATLSTLLSNNEMRAALSKAARHSVEERFTISRMVDGLEAAIQFAHQTQRQLYR